MTQAYKILAKNTRTKQRLLWQSLDGTVITDESRAWDLAHYHAERIQSRSPDQWIGQVERYEVTKS
jgi:hypothetical protein